jgi:cysteine synthase
MSSQAALDRFGDDDAHCLCAAEQQAVSYIRYYARVPVIDLGLVDGTASRILAICGGAHIDASFKNLLGIGMVLLLRRAGLLKPGQPIVESTSGSLGEGLAVAGRIMNHPIILVSDPNLPPLTRRKIELLDTQIEFVRSPHPVLGWQQAREDRVRELATENPSWFWTDQNNSEFNPKAYSTWLLPEVQKQIKASDISAGVFGIGSGGHFSALASWLKSGNPFIRMFAADRMGSITFGGQPGPSRVRGVGNQNIVPDVMRRHMHLVDDVEYVSDRDSFHAARRLANRGLFVGGSSGLVFEAATRVAKRIPGGNILTLFADRGELYADTIWNDQWLATT